uniref:Uncharacterized protein n=1 Tax=Setaria italica TaxID=4555 RepID=K3YZB1_SETIT
MKWLPWEEVDWNLAQSNEPVYAEFCVKCHNLSLLSSSKEWNDDSMVLLYACDRYCYEDEEKFTKFQPLGPLQ